MPTDAILTIGDASPSSAVRRPHSLLDGGKVFLAALKDASSAMSMGRTSHVAEQLAAVEVVLGRMAG